MLRIRSTNCAVEIRSTRHCQKLLQVQLSVRRRSGQGVAMHGAGRSARRACGCVDLLKKPARYLGSASWTRERPREGVADGRRACSTRNLTLPKPARGATTSEHISRQQSSPRAPVRSLSAQTIDVDAGGRAGAMPAGAAQQLCSEGQWRSSRHRSATIDTPIPDKFDKSHCASLPLTASAEGWASHHTSPANKCQAPERTQRLSSVWREGCWHVGGARD